jgi:hypothetical protein
VLALAERPESHSNNALLIRQRGLPQAAKNIMKAIEKL